jgi:hypothetical protein
VSNLVSIWGIDIMAWNGIYGANSGQTAVKQRSKGNLNQYKQHWNQSSWQVYYTFHMINIRWVHRSPQTIKIRVLRDWVSGLSRSKIASSNNIGQGSVTNIIQQAKGDIPDIDLLREVAVAVRKTGLDLSYF